MRAMWRTALLFAASVPMSGWAGGSTRAWRKLRAAVLARDGYRCRAHDEGWCARAGRRGPHTCTVLATHVHHTRGKRMGDHPAYLVAACEPCNLYIGKPVEVADPPAAPITQWGER